MSISNLLRHIIMTGVPTSISCSFSLQVAGLVLFLVPWIYYFLYLNSQCCKIKSGYCNDDDEDVCFKDSECADSVDCNVGDGKSWIFASSDYYPDECLDQSPNYQS